MIILRYILSVIHYLIYGLLLLVFWPIQWLGFNIFGYSGHNKVANLMNYLLGLSMLILGVRFRFQNPYSLPTDRPIVFVSNHQSMYDISAMADHFRVHHVKFVAKMELAKNIPSISYNLTHGGSVLIDRKDRKQALLALKGFAKYLENNNYSTVIYPEGTRSRDGKPKRFSKNGLEMILKYTPSALVVPVTINNSWKIVKDGMFPLNIGLVVDFKVHEPIDNGSKPFDELFDIIEQQVKSSVI